jgi:hypothetical protein
MLLASLVFYPKWSPHPSQQQTPPLDQEIDGLVVSARQLELGDVWEPRRFVHELHIKNRHADAITIKVFHTSCGCLAVAPSSLKLGPDQALWAAAICAHPQSPA